MNDWLAPMRLLLFLALFRMSYEAANISSSTSQEKSFLVESGSPSEDLTAAQKEWAEKAVRRYADAQDKKWRRWNQAMFEAK